MARSPSVTRRRWPISSPASDPCPAIADVSIAQILDAMRHDKKVVSGRLHFVLPTAIGATAIVDDVTDKEMRQALKRVGFRK